MYWVLLKLPYPAPQNIVMNIQIPGYLGHCHATFTDQPNGFRLELAGKTSFRHFRTSNFIISPFLGEREIWGTSKFGKVGQGGRQKGMVPCIRKAYLL